MPISHIRAESRFLYGAPAAGLSGEGEARIVADTNPFPEYSQYQFGRIDDTFSDVEVRLTVPDTDAAGVDAKSPAPSAISPTPRCR